MSTIFNEYGKLVDTELVAAAEAVSVAVRAALEVARKKMSPILSPVELAAYGQYIECVVTGDVSASILLLASKIKKEKSNGK